MKKKLLGLALLGAMMATLLVGCGSSGGKKGDTKDDVITIGFSQVGAESDWRTANSESMKSTFSEKNGYKLILMMLSRNKKTRSQQSATLSNRKLIISYLLR